MRLLRRGTPCRGCSRTIQAPAWDFPARLWQPEAATRTVNQKLFVAKASNDTELAAALGSLLQQRVVALLVGADPDFDTRRDRVIAFAAENKLPAMYQLREFALDGGLISYGPRVINSYRQGGIYAGRILRGAKPGDLPVL